jgi:hypothetical protein
VGVVSPAYVTVSDRGEQYRNIAGSVKTRFENEQFIELFDVDLVTLPQQLPSWFTVHQRLMVRRGKPRALKCAEANLCWGGTTGRKRSGSR